VIIKASAPAKAILFGEHFVVKGYPAIAIALDVRAYVHVRETDKEYIKVRSIDLEEELIMSLDGNIIKNSSNLRPYVEVFEALSEYTRPKPAYVEIKSNIPVAAGLGSSASIAVALTAAYSKFLGIDLDLSEISSIAFKAEKIVHGKPSGIDNSIATYGGGIVFERGRVREKINVEKLRDAIVIVANSGIERSTRTAVLRVLELYEKYPSILKHIYDASKTIIEEALEYIKKGMIKELGELMNINHGLLSAIGVSIAELEDLVYTARKAGALGAKITGAGLGGCIIALTTSKEAEKVEKALKSKAEWVLRAPISIRGVRIEQNIL